MNQLKADVVVIGAGVQGLSTAYHLLLQNVNRVVIVETQDKVGQGSSARSGSMLMKSRENEPKIQLSLHSYERFMNFKSEFGEELKFRKTGFLSLVSEHCATRYKFEHEERLRLGVRSELLTPSEISRLCPAVVLDGIIFGVLGPDDGEIDASQIIRLYSTACKQLGAQILTREPAIGINVSQNRIASVETTLRQIACDFVVNAAGPDAIEVASWVGCKLPIENRRRSLFVTKCASEMFQEGPMVEDAEFEWYYRGLGGGRVLVGMGLELDSLPTDGPNMEFLPTLRDVTLKRAPLLADFEILGGTSGIRSLTSDILPIIGPVDLPHGFVNNCGWGGEGIMHSPSGGQIAADWVTGRTTKFVDTNRFLLSRFKKL